MCVSDKIRDKNAVNKKSYYLEVIIGKNLAAHLEIHIQKFLFPILITFYYG